MKNNFKVLKNKVALITGGSHGIGAGIVEAFVKCGANVIFTYRRHEKKAKNLEKKLGKYSSYISAKYADFNNRRSIISLVKSLIDEKNKIDILVNNAGCINKEGLLSIDEKKFNNIININTTVPLMLIQEVSKMMIKNGTHGSIINISSIRGATVQNKRTEYCCSKAALNMLTMCSAYELAQYNIRVNAISPGLTQSGMNSKLASTCPAKWKQRINSIPLKRPGYPIDHSNLAVFLASDLSEWITGQIINVDGGHTLVSF